MENEKKCEIHNMQIEDLKEEMKELKSKVKELEDKQNKLELVYTELKQDIKGYSAKLTELEVVLKDIATEIKTISNKLLEIDVMRKMEDKEAGGKAGVIDKLLDSNNRTLFYVIITLCSGLLFLIGMNVADITKLFGN